jgi:hypothetical protein
MAATRSSRRWSVVANAPTPGDGGGEGGGGGADLSDAAPAAVGTAAAGTSEDASRADHVHAHGNQLGGALHANAGASAGFMSAADKTFLDTVDGRLDTVEADVATIESAIGATRTAFYFATANCGTSATTFYLRPKCALRREPAEDEYPGEHTGR